MKTLFKLLVIVATLGLFGRANAQILVYNTDTAGVLASVATNATGTNLNRVNGAAEPTAPCTLGGFSTTNFSASTTYSSTEAAVEVTAAPNSGYTLNVTDFHVAIRRSTTGPNNVRYAYSTDGGTTWIDEGSDNFPKNSTCGDTVSSIWTASVSVAYPSTLMFRIYGFNASSVHGTFQVMDLVIDGTVDGSTSSCPVATGLAASSITTSSATLTWAAVAGATSYNLQYRPVGSGSWSTATCGSATFDYTGLTCGTAYEFEVQTVCETGGVSAYSSSTTFVTPSCSGGSGSSGSMAIYFNMPVDNSVSTGVNAVYLNSCMADTIVAYINRAKYSIDIAQYDYNQSSGYANIATAINNAYLSGIKVRWIYDGSQSNTGLALLNSGIPTLASPTTSAYGIMHNKFIIIDANSSNPNDAIVSTGSEDWGITQLNGCANNILFLQDSALAHVYTLEFNMMWGDTGMTPNPTLSKFGPFKTDLGRHTFNIGGRTVELYFSPSDATNTHIISTIDSANTDMYFGVYDLTVAADANAIVARNTAGVYTAGIVDQYSNTGAAYPILTSGLGSMLKTYVSSTYVYHNKMVIVDPSNNCSDPTVLTGSHNWTTSANTLNDENTLIIHNDTVANIYYQSFVANYATFGGTLTSIPNCIPPSCGTPTGVTVSSITTTSAVISWAAVAGAAGYTIRYCVSGSTTWTTTTSATTSVTITGLTSGVVYAVQVQANCSSTSSGLFTGSTTFSTPSLFVANHNYDDLGSFEIYPNPSGRNVTFAYMLTDNADVNVSVCNLLGQTVWSSSSTNQSQGLHTAGCTIAEPGVYLVRVSFGAFSEVKKLLVK